MRLFDFMRRILRPHVADWHVGDVRVIQHDALCDQLALELAIIECVDDATVALVGDHRRSVTSTTIEVFASAFDQEGVAVVHQAVIRSGLKRSCHIKVCADETMTERVKNCFGALTAHLKNEQVKALAEE